MAKKVYSFKCIRSRELDRWTCGKVYQTTDPMSIVDDNGESVRVSGIVGAVDIVDCVSQSESPWFFGQYGFVLWNADVLPFQPCKGALGFFEPKVQL